MISDNKFKMVVENAPLISIDFIIKNTQGNFLLGKRVNKPARGFWFTLGGRIFKNETLDEAIKRLSKKEFNLETTQEMLVFHGVYEHFYDDSFFEDTISTHYVVLVYRLKINHELTLPQKEHTEYRYFSKEELLENSNVHAYVKNYFKGSL
ncbi:MULTISPECIES: GDP-mannose mannosyl hydrolase [unclassified Sulfuricurvum]|uniref:GDP-mannose mannosyl hydrolase n=1 Tax=unclassified Sulfuricurvum TaxID=2632390 RepID=UPI0003215007|nr:MULTISPECIES: GDP-mannose mannosyl hydrolase [unclassified Sulfuricurvum]HBM36358.1 NUDIX domain-containing protein [Sulfuricurvum sp.]